MLTQNNSAWYIFFKASWCKAFNFFWLIIFLLHKNQKKYKQALEWEVNLLTDSGTVNPKIGFRVPEIISRNGKVINDFLHFPPNFCTYIWWFFNVGAIHFENHQIGQNKENPCSNFPSTHILNGVSKTRNPSFSGTRIHHYKWPLSQLKTQCYLDF